MNSTAEAKQLVRMVLMQSATVQAALGSAGAVYSSHPQAPDASAITMPCVILDFAGGAGGYQGGFQHLQFDVYTYSRISQDEADAAYDAAYRALHAQRLASTVTKNAGGLVNPTAGVAREVQRPESGWNKDVDGWWCRGKWIASTAG